ncbi:nicotinamide riboside transporter PnuC [Timonella sp. A28]|uniref:nicotinamide riboside transporter PnuC n=1 Tax=Timonella sp. A28 TaxID=3442640 RepID=UPI003EB8E8AB
MSLIDWLFSAQLHIGDQTLLWREIIGNLFGLTSALGGMRRKVWAWPVGIVGNILLFTVFMGSLFNDADHATLLGQAGRQIMFICVSIYGWVQWKKSKDQSQGSEAITPKWASNRARIGLVVGMIAGTVALTPLFRVLGSYEPVWADAWTFMGSLLATYGMAKGWTEFWLIWVAVDIVGVPLLFSVGYYATGLMYVFYGLFTLVGFFVWWKAQRAAAAQRADVPAS